MRPIRHPLDFCRGPVRALWNYIRFAGGPLRAISRWWSTRRSRKRDREVLAGHASMHGLTPQPGETDAQLRYRVLQRMRGPTTVTAALAEQHRDHVDRGWANKSETEILDDFKATIDVVMSDDGPTPNVFVPPGVDPGTATVVDARG